MTAYYSNLKSELLMLENELLSFDINNQFDNNNQIRMRSYKVFVHASLENYFENIAFDLLDIAKSDWINNSNINCILMHIITYSSLSYSGNKNQTIQIRIENIINEYRSKINNNNGIKEDNIFNLLMPLGYVETDFDNTWLATLNSYGASRGFIAHKSISVQKPFELNNERNIINKIISGIVDVENKYQLLSAKQMWPYAII